MEKLDIILLTCNRCDLSRKTIQGIIDRTRTPWNLIVIDNASKDNTPEMLKEYANNGYIKKLILLGEGETVNIATAYNMGLEFVESELFFCMQDDIIVPDLEPDWMQQLIKLLEDNPEYGGIGAKIQRIPNIDWKQEKDVVDARKSLSAYARVQRKSDVIKMGGFGSRDWDDLAFVGQMAKIGKKCGWAKNIWCNHLGYMVDNRGYAPGYKRMWGWNNRKSDNKLKPYPRVDEKTNIPLPGEKVYR